MHITTDDLDLIGQRLRRIRKRRGMSLQVTAGLAGMSTTHLCDIENGDQTLTNIRMLAALAVALKVPVSELTKLPVPAPGNAAIDAATESVRVALAAVDCGRPSGTVTPPGVLQQRVEHAHNLGRACRLHDVAVLLPGLIRDVHTTLNQGTDRRTVLGTAVYLHAHVTRNWLGYVSAPLDLQRIAVFLCRRLARELGTPEALGMAVFSVVDILATGGVFDLAAAEWDGLVLPPVTEGTAGMLAALLVERALLSVVAGCPGDADGPMGEAEQITARFGEVGEQDPTGFGWGPSDVGFRRTRLALEAGDHETAGAVGDRLNPEENPFLVSRVYHWVGYGRALSGVRSRRDDAVVALRTAEDLHPDRVHRDPFVREVIAGLVERARRNAVGVELGGLAYRAGVMG